jgi:hypothetical protein
VAKEHESAFQEHSGTAKKQKLQPTINKGQQQRKIRKIRTRRGKNYVGNEVGSKYAAGVPVM